MNLGTIAETLEAVSAAWGGRPSPSELRGRTRTRHASEARQAAMLILRECWSMSYPKIGRYLGRDHSTILAGVRSIVGRALVDPLLAARILEAAEDTAPAPSALEELRTILGASSRRRVVLDLELGDAAILLDLARSAGVSPGDYVARLLSQAEPSGVPVKLLHAAQLPRILPP